MKRKLSLWDNFLWGKEERKKGERARKLRVSVAEKIVPVGQLSLLWRFLSELRTGE
jgi:hypothetical protein